jgi:hypothetical protein
VKKKNGEFSLPGARLGHADHEALSEPAGLTRSTILLIHNTPKHYKSWNSSEARHNIFFHLNPLNVNPLIFFLNFIVR